MKKALLVNAMALGVLLGSGPAAGAPGYLVTEIHSNGAHDFWELTNIGDTAGDLGGWSWDDDSQTPGTVGIPGGTIIDPGESVIFTADDAAAFRTTWSLGAGVQVISDSNAPGFGQNDGVFLYDTSGTLVTSFIYAAGGFTRSDGSPSLGGHAGPSAGGSSNAQSAILDPAFPFSAPRYTFADGAALGTTSPSAGETGSPGFNPPYSPPAFSLTVSVSPASFPESAANPAATGTVSRSGDTSAALVVSLSSSDETEATVPATVEIPAGQASAAFDVTAVDDAFPDGGQPVTITATAPAASPDTFDFTVEDDGDTLSVKLMLTEVLSNQSGGAPGGAEDFWELTNFGPEAVDISGHTWHDGGRSFASAAAYALPPGTVIASGESVVFTESDPAVFRAWWGIDSTVQVFQSVGAPGLGKGDGVSFFDDGGNELFFFSYAVGDFTQENGDSSFGENPLDPNDVTDPGHAGIAAGGSEAFQSAVWVPSSGTDSPRYTAAKGTNYGTFTAAVGEDLGSPGRLGAPVDLSTYVRVGRYDLPEPTRTAAPANNLLAQEASGVTYNWDTDTLFICGDGGQSITQVTKTGALVDTMTLALGGSPQGTEFYDPEGITYIGGGEFVFTEERDRQVVKFTYVGGGTLTRAQTETVKLGTFVDNTGLEGLSYDPLTGGFVLVKEISPLGIFQTDIDFTTGSASNGSATTVNSVDLFDPSLTGMSDFADIYALSNLDAFYGGSLLVLSHEDGRIINIDRSGNILSTLSISSDPGNPLSVAGQQHEGLTMDLDGRLYVVNENGGGNIDQPQLWVYEATTVPNQAPTAVALGNALTSLPENTPTFSPVKLGDIVVTDDGLGVNALTVTGPDAAFFEITGTELWLKDGTSLDFETKFTYEITIEVDDASVGTSPDATTGFTLTVIDIEPETSGGPVVIVSEVAPWASGNSPVGEDWFELTNNSNAPIDITGWRFDDESASLADAAPLTGITTIAPGESVIFIDTADLPGATTIFINEWFGGVAPAGLQIGAYSGAGLGTGGDAVFIFDDIGSIVASFAFGASPSAAPYATFDNSAGVAASETLSTVGVFGAFVASSGNEIGSPGTTGPVFVSEAAPWSSGNSPVGEDWFELTNLTGRTIDISGWRMDDSSESSTTAFPLNGVTSIAPGESVIFIETGAPVDLPAAAATFRSHWFGAHPPAGLQIGSYSGSGIGLSTGGDAVNLFDPSGARRARMIFGASPSAAPFASFDNTAGVTDAAVATLSEVGVNGAFEAAAGGEIGSPGLSGPFQNQFLVAAGDVTGTSAWLWARPNSTGTVTFQIGTDSRAFAPLITETVEVTDLTIPGKVWIPGLNPGGEYFYRASINGEQAYGRFVTPAAGGRNGLTFGISGDWRGELTPYPAIANVAGMNLDFFVQLGDTIYADDDSPASAGFANPDQAATLEEFRAKHAEVYGEDQFGFGVNHWADLRSSTTIFATIDDHEVTNDFAGWQDVATDPRFTAAFPGETAVKINESQLYQNGLQVFGEYNPIGTPTYSGTGDPRFDGKPKLYRSVDYGSDARMIILDARSFRDEAIPVPADFTDPAQVAVTYAQTFTPGRTLLGATQLSDLKADLLAAQTNGTTWKIVNIPEPIQEIFPGVQTDAYTGYQAEKADLLKFIQENGIENVVFVAADVHSTFVNNLHYQETPGGPVIPVAAWEITTGSVAYDLPTGEFLAGLAIQTLPPEQQAPTAAFYNSLPIAPSPADLAGPGGTPTDKDDFVEAAINDQLLAPFGFDPLGLDNNLPQADGLINATLLHGDYFVGHTYGWTRFDIDPDTQVLTVTTYGMDAYQETEILDPATRQEVLSRPLQIVSQFTVAPAGLRLADFTLELFHLADQEAAAAAVGDAPRLSAILNKLRDEDLGNDGLPDNTLTLSSGDAIIPGLFFDASRAVYGTEGIADIQIQNELGIQAISFGNHEFDLGTGLIASLIDGSAPGDILGADFGGTNFPYLSGNLDFTTDPNMAPLVTADHQAPQPNKIAATTVIDVNGEPVGVVAATTPTLATISSPGSVGISPSPFGGNPTPAELDALAAGIQADVDALLAANPAIDKVILLAHMQRLDIEQALASRLTDVDIIVGGGSNTRLFDADDRIRAGDSKQGDYPIFLEDADTKPVALVNTDGSYKYLGRLVIGFDADGHILPETYDPVVSGAYATDDQGVADLGAAGFVDPEVQQIADEIEAEIIATDGNYFGLTSVFLNGNRSGLPGDTDGVRTQETNLGNLTADANLMLARSYDPSVVVSLKNGGGIRASIGETVVLPGATEASRIPPTANPLSGRPAGGISENAIKTALAFNNGLSLLTVTKQELVALLEHGVGGVPAASGRFPQIAGVHIAMDESAPAGSRILSAALVDDLGNPTAPLVRNGMLVGDPNQTFRIVTLNFLAGGGDGYPFPAGPAAERLDLYDLDGDSTPDNGFTGSASFAADGTEQDALAEYLAANFSSVPYGETDTPRASDRRIQFVGDRGDVVFQDGLDNGSVLSLLSQVTLSQGAEIGAYDPASGRVFATSGAGVQIVDFSNPAAPVEIALITPQSDGADTNEITSTATSPTEDIMAVAVVGAPKTDPGQVAFYQASTSAFLGLVQVGALPDQIAFTPDGTKLLVCNEGQSADPDENDPLILPNPEGSVAVISMPGGGAAPLQANVAIADFNAFNALADDLRASGVRLYPNVTAAETVVDLDTDLTVSQDLEPEAVAINEAGTTAWVTLQENNAIATVDLATATVTAITPLGVKDHSLAANKLDASNRDGGIHIRNWPVFGLYMPDQVDTFETGGKTYLLTANEGDGRDVDEERIGGVTLDPTAFPAAAGLQDDANLGRLKISSIDGDTDGDGDFDRLFSFGARSFSIWDADTGALVFDSGDQFERITAQLVPELFNSDESDPAEFDSRSDDKGPEPEGLTIGSFNGRTYAFIGLERVGGIMVYDITDPVNPFFVEYKLVPGDAGPEGLIFVDGSDTPTGKPVLIVTNEDSNTLTTFTLELPFTFELLHLADQEAGAAAIGDAPRLSAILNALRAEDLGNDGLPDNTLTLSSGDAIIPGLFYDASAAAFGSPGIADIQIQNELGIQAIAFGNHEFDFGTAAIAGLIDGSAPGDFTNPLLDGTALDDLDFTGAAFPYLSTNLDFSTDPNMAPLEVAGGAAPQPNTVTSSTVLTVNGERFAIIGATTPTLGIISSPGSIGITPVFSGINPTPAELDALAAEIQAEVDAVLGANADINKVILLAHMQQLSIEQEIASRLRGVDIVVGGGSNTRLFDADDRIRAGDSYQGPYPIFATDADGRPVAVVNTDGSYKYLGRLVIDFDANGNIIPGSYDAGVSGAYATDAQGVADLGAAGLVDPEVQALCNAIEAEIIATESNVFGVADVFLNGNRSGTGTAADPDGVRTQETNLGSLTADANLAAARAVDPTVVLSIKNGGGIRASIGRILVPAGGSAPVRLPTAEVVDGGGNLIKPEGGISQNDIQTTLAFNNGLSLLTATKSEIVALLEHGIGGLPGASGRFPQVSGVEFSYDVSRSPGDRLLTAALVDDAGLPTEILVDNGEIAGDPDKPFRLVTLNFLAGGGDGYPFPSGPAANRVDLYDLDGDGPDEILSGGAGFAFDGTEQDAFAEYLLANFNSGTPYGAADVGPAGDLRIQGVGFRPDGVLDGLGFDAFSATYGGLPDDGDAFDLLQEFAYGLSPQGNETTLSLNPDGSVASRGAPRFSIETPADGVELTFTFLRRKNAAAEGLEYINEFSADMSEWYVSPDGVEVIGTDREMEIIKVTFPTYVPVDPFPTSSFFRQRVLNN